MKRDLPPPPFLYPSTESQVRANVRFYENLADYHDKEHRKFKRRAWVCGVIAMFYVVWYLVVEPLL